MNFTTPGPSTHFVWSETNITEHRNIDNTIPDSLIPNVIKTAAKMEIVRSALNNTSVVPSSWFRCLELNRAIGSADTSDHPKGNAVDFLCVGYGNPLAICKRLIAVKADIGFKQLILEHTWVHIAWDHNPGVVPKLEVLSLLSNKKYAIGLTDINGKPYQ